MCQNGCQPPHPVHSQQPAQYRQPTGGCRSVVGATGDILCGRKPESGQRQRLAHAVGVITVQWLWIRRGERGRSFPALGLSRASRILYELFALYSLPGRRPRAFTAARRRAAAIAASARCGPDCFPGLRWALPQRRWQCPAPLRRSRPVGIQSPSVIAPGV